MHLWEIHGASSHEIPRFRRVPPGCANTQGLWFARCRLAPSRGRACLSLTGKLPRVSIFLVLAHGGRASPPGWTRETLVLHRLLPHLWHAAQLVISATVRKLYLCT